MDRNTRKKERRNEALLIRMMQGQLATMKCSGGIRSLQNQILEDGYQDL